MEIELDHQTNTESNLFLRALYAAFRINFGNCAWHFQPNKNSALKLVDFGFVDINRECVLSFSVKYEKKGVIKTLYIKGASDAYSDELDSELRRIVLGVNIKSLEKYRVAVELDLLKWDLMDVGSDSFVIYRDSSGKSKFSTVVSAFDKVDAAYIAGRIFKESADFISVCINSSVRINAISIGSAVDVNISTNFYTGDCAWIDGHPYVGGCVALSEDQAGFIGKIISGEIAPNYLAACAQFNNAEILLSGYKSNEAVHVDAANVLYVSALEACSMLFGVDGSRCDSCGQLKYSIRQRVLDLVSKYLPDRLRRFFDDYYQARSKFLHVGEMSSIGNYYGLSIPQLNPSSASGCDAQLVVPPYHLRELVSYVLRRIMDDLVLDNFNHKQIA